VLFFAYHIYRYIKHERAIKQIACTSINWYNKRRSLIWL